MNKAQQAVAVNIPRRFTDVLYISNHGRLPAEIKRLLRQKKLSCSRLLIEHFSKILQHLNLIGTVIIDAADLNLFEQQKLAGTIESLEMNNIGVIMLGEKIALPVKSFSLAPSKNSFSFIAKTESVSTDELWLRISTNLAYRRKSDNLTVKPPAPPKLNKKSFTNKLEEQLNMTGTLVENLAEQLRLAGLVQHDFLPTNLPNSEQLLWSAIFMPAEWVSGDIYDVRRLDEHHIGFYVADAVGHSMPAALLTIFLKQALVMRETVSNEYRVFSPAEVMKNLNLKMTAQKLSGYQFATCCYCLLNTDTLQMTYSRAGHPYPVLLRSGQKAQQLELRGSLLGIFEQAEYVQQTIQLEPGDRIMLYSDGAEPFIGTFNEQTGFDFNDDFYDCEDLGTVEMSDKLKTIFKNKKIGSAEFDDVTVVILEILQP